MFSIILLRCYSSILRTSFGLKNLPNNIGSMKPTNANPHKPIASGELNKIDQSPSDIANALRKLSPE